jgi:hypothetical protein
MKGQQNLKKFQDDKSKGVNGPDSSPFEFKLPWVFTQYIDDW